MASSVSVSKGIFVHKNGFSHSKSRSKVKKTKENSVFSNYLWYQSFKKLWNSVEAKLHVISSDMFSTTLKDLVNFVQNCCIEKIDEIPTAALLTGINMPDHEVQFTTLTKVIKENVTPHCVTLSGQDCSNLKLLVENMINGFVNNVDEVDYLYDDEADTKIIKKTQCTFSLLQVWYENLYMNDSILNCSNSDSKKKREHISNRKVLVVIIPDLENFNETVLQDFIQIAHSYINILPFVLIFGVATSIDSLHKILPYHVSSKTNIKVFSSQSSISYLNNVLENVLLSENCPFALSGKVFNLFSDIFLFYDFSVTGFIKNFKFAMMEHFSIRNPNGLCSTESAEKILENFTNEDYESLRRIYSFRDLVEQERSYKKRVKLLKDDEYLKKVVLEKVSIIKQYKLNFNIFLRCLNVLVKDLPRTPLGKQFRELYAYATSKNILKSQHFQECFQLLNFQSRDDFSMKLKTIRGIIENNSSKQKGLKIICDKLSEFVEKLESLKTDNSENSKCGENKIMNNVANRKQLRETLVKLSNETKNDYEKLREQILDFLKSIFENYLFEYTSLIFHEIFFFNDISVQNQLVGTQRSAVHSALNDPHNYLKCSCCEIRNDSIILPTMPDICIAYKLHLECGKMINLYDWLQSFISIVDPEVDENENGKIKIDPKLQARFTQAVVELEYLGFVKTSKRKTDHVQRLTWGG